MALTRHHVDNYLALVGACGAIHFLGLHVIGLVDAAARILPLGRRIRLLLGSDKVCQHVAASVSDALASQLAHNGFHCRLCHLLKAAIALGIDAAAGAAAAVGAAAAAAGVAVITGIAEALCETIKGIRVPSGQRVAAIETGTGARAVGIVVGKAQRQLIVQMAGKCQWHQQRGQRQEQLIAVNAVSVDAAAATATLLTAGALAVAVSLAFAMLCCNEQSNEIERKLRKSRQSIKFDVTVGHES